MGVRTRLVRALPVIALVAAGCGGGPGRDETVAAIATDGAQALNAMVPVADEATDAVVAACKSGKPADVDVAVDKVATARTRWHETEAWWMGPATDLRANALVDWPANPDDVDDLLAATDPTVIDADYLAEFVGADTRGYGAAAYVLEGAPLEARACDFAVAATTLAASTIADVSEAWTDPAEGQPYRSELSEGDQGLDVVVNQLLPLLASREPTNVAARGASIEDLLFGSDGDSGLTPLLNDDLVTRLRAETDRLLAAADLAEPTDEKAPAEYLAAAEALRATVATEVVAALGVTVTFSDADGDSAG
jgi:predicted lipoprotein